MKKFFGIAICLLLSICVVLPVASFADAAGSTSYVAYFLNPTAIAAADGKLYVADNIEDQKSVIYCFDTSEETPAYRYTTDVTGNIVNLSVKEGGLYAIFTDRVVEYATGETLTEQKIFNVQDAVDFVSGVINISDDKGEYYATKEQFFVKDPRCSDPQEANYFSPFGFGSQSDIKGMVSIGQYVYCLFSSDGNIVCQRIDGQITRPAGTTTDPLNKNSTLLASVDPAPKGIFAYEQKVGIFSDSEIRFVEIAESTSTVTDTVVDYDANEKGNICDVVADGEKIFVLNAQHKVEIFAKVSDKFQSNAVIGTETVTDDVPSVDELNSFTLVQCVGHPANIIFKTEGENSIAELIDDATEYVVLGYDGDENADFYYVLSGDKFGWVKKSNGATSPQNDAKLKVINTSVGDGTLTYNAKFVSLHTVWIRQLPRKSFPQIAFEQTASTRQNVVVLQRFTEGDTVWYYIRYDGDKFGFVEAENIGSFYIQTASETKVEGQRKINTSLFGTVTIYDNGDPDTMTDEHLAIDSEGNTVRMHAGQRVTLVESYENGVSLVYVDLGDGNNAAGYVKTDELIATTALTTNAIFGIVVTAIAIVLAITLTVVFVQRSKKRRKTTAPVQIEQSEQLDE